MLPQTHKSLKSAAAKQALPFHFIVKIVFFPFCISPSLNF